MRNPRILSIVFFGSFFSFSSSSSSSLLFGSLNISTWAYIKLMCVFVTPRRLWTHKHRVLLYSIVYLLLSFTDCPHQKREKKKDLMRWKITNNRCSHAQVKRRRNDEKKTNKQTKEEEKRNSLGVSREGRVFLEELWSSRIYLLTRRRRKKRPKYLHAAR